MNISNYSSLKSESGSNYSKSLVLPNANSQLPLAKLPIEIWAQLSSYLSINCLNRFSRTSKYAWTVLSEIERTNFNGLKGVLFDYISKIAAQSNDQKKSDLFRGVADRLNQIQQRDVLQFVSFKEHFIGMDNEIIDILRHLEDGDKQSLRFIAANTRDSASPFFKNSINAASVLSRYQISNEVQLDASTAASLSEELFSFGKHDWAIKVAGLMKPGPLKSEVLYYVSQKLVSSGEYDRGVRVAFSMDPVEIDDRDAVTGKAAAIKNACLKLLDHGKIMFAFETAKSLPNPELLSDVLAMISQTMLQRKEFRRATETAQLISDLNIRGKSLYLAANALFESGNYQSMFDVIRLIPDKDRQEECFVKACCLLNRKREFRWAVLFAGTISDGSKKNGALHMTCQCLLEHRQFRDAIETAKSMTSGDSLGLAQRAIADALIDAREFDQAIEFAQKIFNPKDRKAVLCKIYDNLTLLKQSEKANEVALLIREMGVVCDKRVLL